MYRYASPVLFLRLPPPIGGGSTRENLLLRAGTSGGGSLADFCCSFREGDPGRITPEGVLMPGRRSRLAEKRCSVIS
jgi:hypothetical protein